MEQAQNTRSQAPTQGVAPLKVFIALLVLLGVTLLAWYLTRPDEVVSTSGRPGDSRQSSTLTEAEAIQEFERLFALNIQAYRQRDESLIKLYAAPDAPKLLEAHEEIRQLLKDGVLDRTSYRHLGVETISISPNEVELVHRVEIYPKFVMESTGRDVTRGRPRVLTMRWTMRLYDQGWLLYRGRIVDAKAVG